MQEDPVIVMRALPDHPGYEEGQAVDEAGGLVGAGTGTKAADNGNGLEEGLLHRAGGWVEVKGGQRGLWVEEDGGVSGSKVAVLAQTQGDCARSIVRFIMAGPEGIGNGQHVFWGEI